MWCCLFSENGRGCGQLKRKVKVRHIVWYVNFNALLCKLLTNRCKIYTLQVLLVHRVTSTYRTVRLWLVIALGWCVIACSSDKGDRLPLYAIERVDYADVLDIEGFTEPVNAVNINCPPEVDGAILSLVETGTIVKKGDVVCVLEDAEIESRIEQWELDLESTYAEMDKLEATHQLEYALLEAQVQNNEAEALLADYDSLQMLYMSPMERRIKKLQQERARIERAQLLKKLDVTGVVHETDVMRLKKRIEWMERQLEKECKKKESLTLRAPNDGIVVRARRHHWSKDTWNIGDNVWNGRTVVTIPDIARMKVLIHAQETEYKRLHEGDSVSYTFDAMPDNRAWGRIAKLSPVGQTRTEGSAVKTFEIEASVDSMLVPIDPGMSVQCRVYLRHIPDTIVIPTISVFDKDSVKVVYVERGGKYEERLVTLGEGSPRSTIVVSGLKPGERISLMRPKEN